MTRQTGSLFRNTRFMNRKTGSLFRNTRFMNRKTGSLFRNTRFMIRLTGSLTSSGTVYLTTRNDTPPPDDVLSSHISITSPRVEKQAKMEDFLPLYKAMIAVQKCNTFYVSLSILSKHFSEQNNTLQASLNQENPSIFEFY